MTTIHRFRTVLAIAAILSFTTFSTEVEAHKPTYKPATLVSLEIQRTNRLSVHVENIVQKSVQVLIINNDLQVVYNQYFKVVDHKLGQTFNLNNLPAGQYNFYVIVGGKITKKEVTVTYN